MFKIVVTAFVLMWSALGSASVPVYDLNAQSPITLNHGSNTSFTDLFMFTVPANQIGGVDLLKLDLSFGNTPLYEISNFTVSTSSPGLSFSALYNNSNQLTGFESSAVPSGSYSFEVSGLTTGQSGGSYLASFVSVPTAVPLPAAVWLFGSTLLGFLSISKRKHLI